MSSLERVGFVLWCHSAAYRWIS